MACNEASGRVDGVGKSFVDSIGDDPVSGSFPATKLAAGVGSSCPTMLPFNHGILMMSESCAERRCGAYWTRIHQDM